MASDSALGLAFGRQGATGERYIGITSGTNPDMVFSANSGAELMRITDSGKVGIGATAPAQSLDIGNGNLLVQGNINSTGTTALGTKGAVGSRNTLNLYADGSRLLFSTAAASPNWKISAQDDVNKALEIAVGRNTDDDASDDTFSVLMTVNNDSNVGIGTGATAPAQRLEVKTTAEGNVIRLNDGTETCDLDPDAGGVTQTCSSDENLKQNIRNASSLLGKYSSLVIREFEVKLSNETRVGIIAQEVNKTNPEMVKVIRIPIFNETTKETLFREQLGVEVPNTWEIIKIIQELKKENDLLRQRVAVLEGR